MKTKNTLSLIGLKYNYCYTHRRCLLEYVRAGKMFSKSPRTSAKSQGHQQLTSDTADEKDQVIAGIQFTVRYVGSTEVAGHCGTGSGKTETVVAKIFKQKDLKTLKKMVMTVCSTSVSLCDESTGKLVANFPISLITYCNTDKSRERAFVFVARHRKENPFKAFVFQCETKQKAQELFKALSLGFTINYENVLAKRLQEARLQLNFGSTANSDSSGDEVCCACGDEKDTLKTVEEISKGNLPGEKRKNGVKIPFHMYVAQTDSRESSASVFNTPSVQGDARARSKTEPQAVSLNKPLYANGLPHNNTNCASDPLLISHGFEDDEFAQFVQQRSRSTSESPGPFL